MKLLSLAKYGLFISIGPATIVTVYKFCENNSLDHLLFLVPSLLLSILVSVAISYYAVRRFDTASDGQPVAAMLVVYALAMIAVAPVIIGFFIQFKIENAYLLLPIALSAAGGVIFACIARTLMAVAGYRKNE